MQVFIGAKTRGWRHAQFIAGGSGHQPPRLRCHIAQDAPGPETVDRYQFLTGESVMVGDEVTLCITYRLVSLRCRHVIPTCVLRDTSKMGEVGHRTEAFRI